jgi:hypothetical protein
MCTTIRRCRILGLAILFSTVSLLNCELIGPSVDHFVIRVADISAPSIISASDTLQIRFAGGIGPDGCWGLDRVDRQLTKARLELTFRGKHEDRIGFDCPQMPTALDYLEKIVPPLETPFSITVHQPDGSLLRRQVIVQ